MAGVWIEFAHVPANRIIDRQRPVLVVPFLERPTDGTTVKKPLTARAGTEIPTRWPSTKPQFVRL